MISKYRDLGILRFWSSMGFDRLEAVASLDAYQITNYQFLSKTHLFFVAWFLKNSRNKFLNQEFYGQLPEKAWSKGLFDFSKSYPTGHQGFQKISKWKKMFIKMGSLPTVITNSLGFLSFKNLKTFSPIFSPFFFGTGIYSLFRSISKIHDDKNIWNINSFISCICWHRAMFTYFKSAIRNEKN